MNLTQILIVAAFIAGLVLGGWAGHSATQKAWQVKWDAHVAADAKEAAARKDAYDKAVADAVAKEKAQAEANTKAAVAEAEAQQKIVVRTQTTVKEVPTYVPTEVDQRTCVTYGLVRVLDAAASGRSPADLELPAGQSDDACAPVTASALAANVASNYGVALQNAQQLDALIEQQQSMVDRFNQGDPTR